MEESAKPDDTEFSQNGIKFLISEKNAPYFQNTKLDFVKGVFGNGQFKLLKI
ncbi:hypothetical protein HYG86_02595 [Alkalicella caledoniensis]|uniref:Uncharacterized protein n=1 Tax=Alkalicella caledoniensis TaxID=2731377 RepID=A0A7G9WD30_ALKCA|nr:hypothetical protein HYG86_02595 [Alkalicella caledoniensis]